MSAASAKRSKAAPGTYPVGAASLRAQVLAVMLAPDDMTGVDSIFEHRKVSLHTVVRALVRKYEWPIERRDFPTNTADGRAAWASVYCLPREVIDAALAGQGADWLDGVRAARMARARRR
ncbi:hypothetical protein [Massilia sp. CF038]|uniref:hypothetical protein n=1 Tax=Massilia sp. CF038 TaxID=1881045 RepID=UPI000910E626|nr:hypothetical protein [Massilia sp. CF038]SHH04538.1 hypothetical protein SAMN05428948_2488 [Massilia sp. CF038]